MTRELQLDELTDVLPAMEETLPQASWLLDVTIPPESLKGFREDYEHELATFPEDLSHTTDAKKVEDFVSAAHSLVRRWLPGDMIRRLERFIHDESQPSALVIRGLPMDSDLPPTGEDGWLKKYEQRKYLSDTWLVGICRIVGQPFMLTYLAHGKLGISALVREMHPTPKTVGEVSAQGSREFLDFHSDFFQATPECLPVVISFIGLRGDPKKVGRTLLCDHRELYSKISRADVETLREQKISWHLADGKLLFAVYIIEGSETNPFISLFNEDVQGLPGFDVMVKGTPEAVAAYKRVKDLAHELGTSREGVFLDAGDLVLLNQRRISHARTSFTASYDGNDRWLQKVFVHEGCFWEPSGPVPWPKRQVPVSSRS